MRDYYYRKLVKKLKEWLEYQGFAIIKENRYCYIFDMSAEQIVLPKRMEFGYVQIYFTKTIDKSITKEYYYKGPFWRNPYEEFTKIVNKRIFENIARYDEIHTSF